VAYAAEWELDDPVLDREEVDAVVTHVAALARVAAEVTCSQAGLHCTFRVPAAAAADVVSALDPEGELLGADWLRDLDPPVDGEDGYVVRVELVGPVEGGTCDDAEAVDEPEDHDEALDEDEAAGRYDDDDDDDERDLGDEAGDAACRARLRIESLDNREAWPVAFVLAAALVDRLGGDLLDQIDEELFELQRRLPPILIRSSDDRGPILHPGSRRDRPDEEDLLN
jgi:hypothetical protein